MTEPKNKHNYYDSLSEGYQELHGEEQLTKARIIRDNLQIKKRFKLLDVGCGTGFYLNIFDCYVFGIDPAQKLLEKNPFPSQNACAENIPFPDNSFDTVISITAIHNFSDKEKSFEEIKRVAKPKAQLAFSVLKKALQFEKIDNLIKKHFLLKKIILEEKDVIYFLENIP